MAYQIVRFYEDDRGRKIIKNNLTLEEAKEWCNDPETSSMTAKDACNGDEEMIEKWHEERKHWFDGFEHE